MVVAKRLDALVPARRTTGGGGDEATASSATAMDAARVAAILDKIDEYAAAAGGSPMSANRVASICGMIADGDAEPEGRSNKRRNRNRNRLCVDSIHSYKHVGEIGSGTFGKVVKACHRETGQTVAVKTLTFPAATRHGGDVPPRDDDVVSEVLREACFLAACGGHPNLVGLHTVAREPGTSNYSVVMEYAGGRSLHHALDENEWPFSEAEVRPVIGQLLAGAEAMHRLQIIHRDIKPENVILAGSQGKNGLGLGGVVKICDYGLALSTARARPSYAQVGTIQFMAPEVLMQRPEYDERVDLWAIGCVMAELLSGDVLFDVANDDIERYIYKVFDVLGTPAEDTFETFMSASVASEVRRRRRRQWQWRARPPRRHSCRLRELFPRHVLSQDGYRVLRGLLTCNPNERLTAAAALQLPWFTDAGNDGVLASEVPALPFVLLLTTSAWAFLRKLTLPLTKLPAIFLLNRKIKGRPGIV